LTVNAGLDVGVTITVVVGIGASVGSAVGAVVGGSGVVTAAGTVVDRTVVAVEGNDVVACGLGVRLKVVA
jgi:hypothetical protein